jgi:dephospho-CoA kinase
VKVFGLTGGIGMGKSACTAVLRRRGLPVIDTDDLARDLVEPGQPALAEIRSAFGDAVFDPQGRLDRAALAARVFADAPARQQLEAILHPRIMTAWVDELARWQADGAAAAVVVIPLLFETGVQDRFDATVCVACSAGTQRARLLARGWSGEEMVRRSAAQMPVTEKIARSRFVLWTEGHLDVLEAQVARVF